MVWWWFCIFITTARGKLPEFPFKLTDRHMTVFLMLTGRQGHQQGHGFASLLHLSSMLPLFIGGQEGQFLTSPINMSLRSIMWDAAAPIRPRKCSVLTHRASLVDEWSPLLPSLILLDRGCRQEAQSSNRQQRHIWPQGEQHTWRVSMQNCLMRAKYGQTV